jgi:ADP-heptose:LPS heptosyltransferase
MGIPVVVVGGQEDAAEGEKIVAGKSGLNLAGKTSLGETAAVIAKSTLLVSTDSGILHIGVGLGKRTVSLFGPGIVKKWAPRGPRHIVINRNLPCSPCTRFGYTPRCPISARCMTEITVDEVVAAVERIIENL